MLYLSLNFIFKVLYIQRELLLFNLSPRKNTACLLSQYCYFWQLVDEYSQSSWIFQLGRRFNVTLDIILNKENIHKVFDSYYVQDKIGNVFLKYSQKPGYCFSCGRVLFTNVFPPNNTHLPVFTFIYQQKTVTIEFQVALWVWFWPLFFWEVVEVLRGEAVLFVSVCMRKCVHKLLKDQRFGFYYVDPKTSLAVPYIYTKRRPLVMLISFNKSSLSLYHHSCMEWHLHYVVRYHS